MNIGSLPTEILPVVYYKTRFGPDIYLLVHEGSLQKIRLDRNSVGNVKEFNTDEFSCVLVNSIFQCDGMYDAREVRIVPRMNGYLLILVTQMVGKYEPAGRFPYSFGVSHAK